MGQVAVSYTHLDVYKRQTNQRTKEQYNNEETENEKGRYPE